MCHAICRFLALSFLASLWLAFTVNLWASTQKTEILIVMDASASMEDTLKFENSTKLQKAKESIEEVFTGLPPEFFTQNNVGLRVYGHRYGWQEEAKSCVDTELIIPISKIDPKRLITRVNDLKARGNTPIAYSLTKGAEDFSKDKEVRRYILLVSDGAETCGGDPVAVIRELQERGINIMVNTIGFAVTEEARKQLEGIASASGGRYYSAKASKELKTELEKLLLKPEPEIEPDDLIAQVNGGVLVASTNKGFQFLNDGQDSPIKAWFKPDDEAVFAFKGEQPAMIRGFSLPVLESSPANLKGFDLYVSTKGPTSGWQKVGTYELPNMVFEDRRYHVFNLAQPVVARYVKFKVLSGYGDIVIGLYELKVFGDLGAKIEPAAPEEINLLALSQGGQLIASSNNKMFSQLIDGREEAVSPFSPGQEAIFAFKDKKIVTLEKIAIPIFGAYIRNIKEILIWVSTSENPLKGYEPAGRFEVANLTFADNPYQEFVFDKPVQARYLKIKLGSAQGENEYIVLYELRAYGKTE
ncbi:MAG TPA: VWA domain-containing protein [Candidatus Hypogeohydataceae bacterium YC38]